MEPDLRKREKNAKNLILNWRSRTCRVDKSFYCKVKHWKGKDLKRRPVWVFGLVERADGESNGRTYMQIVKDRGACTNRIESLWRACKYKFKEMNGCKRVYIQSYIDGFLIRIL
ncbi:unnamed protein product [Brachionus calyciflorus]|uniref:Uncharacterized protein n=1 Tax=Brachionus calyciflorus TaxID=104777 RepID=A0A814J2K0_9BILA|nr:unnamed protein product [Brachionus calyciflorus]